MVPEYIIPVIVGLVIVVVAVLVAVCIPMRPCSKDKAPNLNASSEVFYRRRHYSVSSVHASNENLEMTESTPVYAQNPFPGNKSSVTDFQEAQAQMSEISNIEAFNTDILTPGVGKVPGTFFDETSTDDIIAMASLADPGYATVMGHSPDGTIITDIPDTPESGISGDVGPESYVTEVVIGDDVITASNDNINLAGSIEHVIASNGEIYSLPMKKSSLTGHPDYDYHNEMTSKTSL